MKLPKLIFILALTITFSIFISFNYKNLDQTQINPIASENNFYSKLNYALNLSQLQTSSYVFKDFQKEIDFFVTDDFNKKPILVKLSTQKDPYLQVTSLQEILKVAKIKDKDVKLIDLHLDHPYVTF